MTGIPLLVKTSECKQFRCICFENQRFFLNCFVAFFEFVLNFEHFQKKMTLIAYVFPKLTTTNDVLRYMSKNSGLRGPLDRRHGKQSKILIQS